MLARLPRVITPANAAVMGISEARTRSEVKRGNWQRLANGAVLARPEPPTREDWACVGLQLAGPGAAISGWDAVRARGIGDPSPSRSTVLVLSRGGMNRTVGGVLIRPTNRPFSSKRQPIGAMWESLPLAHCARAVADVALDYSRVSPIRAVIGQALLRRYCTLDELLAEYEGGPRKGSWGLRQALHEALDGARSAAEAQAARRLTCPLVPAFELNVPVVDQHGRELRTIDVFWRALRVALEIDSRRYHSDPLAWDATLTRHTGLTRFHLAVLHYAPSTIASSHTFVPDVARFLTERATELGVPMPGGHGVIRPPRGQRPPPYLVRVP